MMTIIGIIADTHNLDDFNQAWPKIKRTFKECSVIVHAGDIVHQEVLTRLSKIALTKAIAGNNKKDLLIYPSLPRIIILRFDRISIGVVHGLGNQPRRILDIILGKIGLGKLREQIYYSRINSFFPERVDCIVFGDLHQSVIYRANNRLFFNPGSTNKKGERFGSCGILKINKRIIYPEIVCLTADT